MVEAFPNSRSIQHSGDSHWFSPTFINTVKLRFVTTASVLLRLLCCCDLTRKGFRERFVEAPHPQTWLHANGRVNVLWAVFWRTDVVADQSHSSLRKRNSDPKSRRRSGVENGYSHRWVLICSVWPWLQRGASESWGSFSSSVQPRPPRSGNRIR